MRPWGRLGRAGWAAAAVIALVGLLAFTLLRREVRHRPPATPPDAVRLWWPPLAEGEAAVLFGGDVLLGDAWEPLLRRDGADDALAGLTPAFHSAHAAAIVANHEGAITTLARPQPPNKGWNYGADPAFVPALARAGVTHLGLANNHALDRGMEGLADTREHLRRAGVEPFGAGESREVALAPAVIHAGDTSVAVFAAMWPWPKYRDAGWRATEQEGGMAFVTTVDVEEGLGRAAKAADVAVFFPHWGREYGVERPEQADWARKARALGADVVIGHHSHEAQAWGTLDGMPVVWSAGNCAFGTRGRWKKGQGHGLLVRLVTADHQLRRVEVLALAVDNVAVGFRPHPWDEARGLEILRGLASRPLSIGPGWVGATVHPVGAVAVMDVGP